MGGAALAAWAILTLGLVPAASRSGACATSGPWVGWIVLGAGLVLGALTLLVPEIARLVETLRSGA